MPKPPPAPDAYHQPGASDPDDGAYCVGDALDVPSHRDEPLALLVPRVIGLGLTLADLALLAIHELETDRPTEERPTVNHSHPDKDTEQSIGHEAHAILIDHESVADRLSEARIAGAHELHSDLAFHETDHAPLHEDHPKSEEE